MGMGEPLLNLRAVAAAALFLNRDLGIGARHITLSTVGVPNAIGMLADTLVREQLQLTLAVSLHAPNQALRQQIVPRCAAPAMQRPSVSPVPCWSNLVVPCIAPAVAACTHVL